MREVDAIIRKTTIENFGPVRSVKRWSSNLGSKASRSAHVTKAASVRFPRMRRWLKDKPVDEADTLDALRSLVEFDRAS
jgi:DNA ligase-1